MDIIIDSNIYMRDFKLKEKNIEIILDYISKTNSSIIFPRIVIEEIKNLYKKKLKDNFNTYNASIAKLKSILINTVESNNVTVDFDKETDDYVNFVFEKLNIIEDNIIDYKNEFLPELVKRAINRIKPLGENGQQFRDGLLWLTLLDYAERAENKEIIFISANSNDFAEKNTATLHRQLQEELQEKGLTIHYYIDIDSFIESQASKIDFITEAWISENVNQEKLEEIFVAILGENQEERVKDSVNLDRNEYLTGYVNRTEYIYSAIQDHYVYEKQDGKIILKLFVEFETEYELEIMRRKERDESKYDYRIIINPRTGESEYEMDFIPDYSLDEEYDTTYSNPTFIGHFNITIDNSEVTEIELADWESS